MGNKNTEEIVDKIANVRQDLHIELIAQPSIIETYVNILGIRGYKSITSSETLEESLKKSKTHTPEVVIVDEDFGEKISTYKTEIKQIRPETAVIIMGTHSKKKLGGLGDAYLSRSLVDKPAYISDIINQSLQNSHQNL